MKTINKTSLLLALIILAIAFSIISMIAIYSLSELIIAYLWWRIYALVNKFRRS